MAESNIDYGNGDGTLAQSVVAQTAGVDADSSTKIPAGNGAAANPATDTDTITPTTTNPTSPDDALATANSDGANNVVKTTDSLDGNLDVKNGTTTGNEIKEGGHLEADLLARSGSVSPTKIDGKGKTTAKKTSFKPVSLNRAFLNKDSASGSGAMPSTSLGSATQSKGPSPLSSSGPGASKQAAASKLKLVSRTAASSIARSESNASPMTVKEQAQAVWNKNKPKTPPPPQGKMTDEELEKKFGIHLQPRLGPDDVTDTKEKWADIDDDDDDWVPEEFEWNDGMKANVKDEPPAPAAVVTPSTEMSDTLTTEAREVPRERSREPVLKPTLTLARGAPTPSPSKSPVQPLSAKGSPGPKTLITAKHSAKPDAPEAPLPRVSPWAKLPAATTIAPMPVNRKMAPPPPSSDARLDSWREPPPALKEVSADAYDRTWRGGSHTSRELFNSTTGQMEPVQDPRNRRVSRGNREEPSMNKPAVLQRPQPQHPKQDVRAPEPSAAFQEHRTSNASHYNEQFRRRRTSSNVSGGSGSFGRRMSFSRFGPDNAILDDPTLSHAHGRPPSSHVFDDRRGSMTHGPTTHQFHRPPVPLSPQTRAFSPVSPLADVHAPISEPVHQAPEVPEADLVAAQEKIMKATREEARRRKLEEEAKEEAAKKERLRIKLDALEKQAEKAKAEKEAAARQKAEEEQRLKEAAEAKRKAEAEAAEQKRVAEEEQRKRLSAEKRRAAQEVIAAVAADREREAQEAKQQELQREQRRVEQQQEAQAHQHPQAYQHPNQRAVSGGGGGSAPSRAFGGAGSRAPFLNQYQPSQQAFAPPPHQPSNRPFPAAVLSPPLSSAVPSTSSTTTTTPPHHHSLPTGRDSFVAPSIAQPLSANSIPSTMPSVAARLNHHAGNGGGRHQVWNAPRNAGPSPYGSIGDGPRPNNGQGQGLLHQAQPSGPSGNYGYHQGRGNMPYNQGYNNNRGRGGLSQASRPKRDNASKPFVPVTSSVHTAEAQAAGVSAWGNAFKTLAEAEAEQRSQLRAARLEREARGEESGVVKVVTLESEFRAAATSYDVDGKGVRSITSKVTATHGGEEVNKIGFQGLPPSAKSSADVLVTAGVSLQDSAKVTQTPAVPQAGVPIAAQPATASSANGHPAPVSLALFQKRCIAACDNTARSSAPESSGHNEVHTPGPYKVLIPRVKPTNHFIVPAVPVVPSHKSKGSDFDRVMNNIKSTLKTKAQTSPQPVESYSITAPPTSPSTGANVRIPLKHFNIDADAPPDTDVFNASAHPRDFGSTPRVALPLGKALSGDARIAPAFRVPTAVVKASGDARLQVASKTDGQGLMVENYHGGHHHHHGRRGGRGARVRVHVPRRQN